MQKITLLIKRIVIKLYKNPTKSLISLIAILFSTFQLYSVGRGVYLSIIQRSIHLAFVLPLTFLIHPTKAGAKNKFFRILDILLAILGAIAMIYIATNYHEIARRGGMPNQTDIFFGVITIIIVLESARRSVGLPITLLSILALIYAFGGPYFPGRIAHRGYTISRVVDHLYMTTEGIFGIALGASATFVFLFIFLGTVLQTTGLDIYLSNIAKGIAGSFTGGPAQVAVLSSALFGSISGTAVGNVTSTGAFTIPLMKRVGYQPYFAASVEAVASTGGQIMPPIMGAAAFIMAEFTGIPYLTIIISASVPAFLYYFGCAATIYFRSAKLGFKGLPKEELPDPKKALKEGGHLIIPIFVIIILLVLGYTPLYAGFYSVFAAIFISFIRKETRMSYNQIIEIMIQGGKNAITVANACAVVGILIGIISLTGTGVSIGHQVVRLGGDVRIYGLILSAFMAMIMGLGIPTTVVYILMATFAAPPLVELGFPVLSAHLFVFYFALLALVTPPVCLAAYAAAGIAGSPPFKTGWTAARLAVAGYIIPFVFALSPELIFIEANLINFSIVFFSTVAGILALSMASEGYIYKKISFIIRFFLFIAAMLLIIPGLVTNIFGATVLFLVVLKEKS